MNCNENSVKINGNFCENMKIIILLSIALVSATQVNPPPRSVNVALETSFLFEPKDLDDNKSLVNNIRGFLDKLSRLLGPDTAEKRFRTETKPEMPEERRFWEFMQAMNLFGQHFLNMTGTKIKEALEIIHDKVKNITEKATPIITPLLPTRSQDIIQDLISTLMHSKPEDIKIIINSTVRENKPLLTTFARRMNTYYNDDDVKKLNKILKKFKKCIENNKDTTKIIKKLLHNTIFKKYDNLNESARAAVVNDLKMLSKFLFAKNSFTDQETRWNPASHGVGDDKVNLPDDITYTALRRSIDKKIRDAREKNENIETANKDAFVGNVELFLEPPQKS